MSFARFAGTIIGLSLLVPLLTAGFVGCTQSRQQAACLHEGHGEPAAQPSFPIRGKLRIFADLYPRIVRDFASSDPAVRSEAVKDLELITDDEGLALPLILMALRDPHPAVCRAACGVLLTPGWPPRIRREYISEDILELMTDMILHGVPSAAGDEEYMAREIRDTAGVILRHYATPHILARLARAYVSDAGRTVGRDVTMMWIFIDSQEPRLVPMLVGMLDRATVYWEGFSSPNINTVITASPADSALFALIHMTHQDLDNYRFHVGEIGARPVTMPYFDDHDARIESIAKFRKWWEKHKSKYDNMPPLVVATPPAATPATQANGGR